MKNTLKKTLLSIIVSVLVFVAAMPTAYAVAQTITLGGTEIIEGYVSGVKFTTKTKSNGEYVYCLDMNKKTAKNVTATLKGERDAGVAYIMANGYPVKSFTGERLKDYYITQTALWWYLDDTTGSSNLSEKFKTTGSDPHNIRPTIKKLVEAAKVAKNNGYQKVSLELTTSSKDMALSNGYYVSKEITAKASNLSDYSVTLTNAPEGTQIVSTNGTAKTTFAPTEKFIIKVPASKIKNTEIDIKVTASGTGSYYKAYEYTPSDSSMQPVGLIEKITDKASASITLSIESSKVTIIKIDKKTNQPLAGAKLVVKDSAGNTLTSWTSTTNGHVIRNLKPGTYTVTEVSAPTGYKLNSTPITFKITAANEAVTVKVYNEPKQSVVNILKIDNSTQQPLAGATLVVKNSAGEEIVRFTTTTEPYVLTDLQDGTYTVEEIAAPTGYILSSEKITFTIDDDNLSHQITFGNNPEVEVPDTASSSSIIFTLLGIAMISLGFGFVHKNGKTTQ